MRTKAILFILLFFVSCVTPQQLTRRQKDKQFFVKCVKELFHEGMTEDRAIEACKEAGNQPN